MTDQPPQPPAILNRFVQMVLSYKPKPKTKLARTRARKAKNIAKGQTEAKHMKTHELIENLRDADPDGEAEVFIYIHRRYGGSQYIPYEVREFVPGDGKIYICDEGDPNV